MPEGDTIHRAAAGLRPHLVGRAVLQARASGRAQVDRLVGTTIESIETSGKNLLVHVSGGLSLRTHLGMTGAWHVYRPGERWLRSPARAALVLEVEGVVAVCFDAPVVELFATRSRALHPALSHLGPDLLDDAFDTAAALRRLRDRSPPDATIGEALLDQHAMAGIGNVFRSEILFIERVAPVATVHALDDATLERVIATARRLLVLNAGSRRARTTTDRAREAAGLALWVYGRAGRPCRRCGALIRAMRVGHDLPRTVWWCPRCQAPAAGLRQAPARVSTDETEP